MALEKINLTYQEAYKTSMETHQAFKLPEWEFTVMADPFAELLFNGEKEKRRFPSEQDKQRTDWQLVTNEFSVDGPIDAVHVFGKNTSIVDATKAFNTLQPLHCDGATNFPNIIFLKEKFKFFYHHVYDGFMYCDPKIIKQHQEGEYVASYHYIFFKDNTFSLWLKPTEMKRSKVTDLTIQSEEDLQAAIKLLNLPTQ